MPSSYIRSAALAFICLLAPCILPQPSAAAQIAAGPEGGAYGDIPAGPSDDAEENPRPAILSPRREPQIAPQALGEAILAALVKKEEAARLEAEAEERLLAEQRAREEREQSLKDQREAEENARVLRERAQARARSLDSAVKNVALPPVGVTPAKADWPLGGPVEEPAWNAPELAPFFQRPYSEEEIKAAYRALLDKAVHGNPRAMTALAYAYGRWGEGISGPFSVIYPPMHSGDYWRNWALRMTSADWVELRLAELSLERQEKLEHYRAAAADGNSEALYRLSFLEDQPGLLVEAAAAGHARACSAAAFNLGVGTGGFPLSPQRAAFYWWRGALAGDARSMLVCSEFFYQGQNGFPKDDRRSYFFALLALETLGRLDSAAPDGNDADLLPTVERHLRGLVAALGLSRDDLWELRQDLEIFRAAPEEQRRALLEKARPGREAALSDLESELAMLRAVLSGGEDGLSEEAILAKFEQARADSEMERFRRARMLLKNERERDNNYFFRLGAFGLAALLAGYLSLRLRVYARVVRFMSAEPKEGI